MAPLRRKEAGECIHVFPTSKESDIGKYKQLLSHLESIPFLLTFLNENILF